MASSQNTIWELPSLAAQPTQTVPTTKTICVRTRSKRPSSFFKAPLRASTARSMVARLVSFGSIIRLPKDLQWISLNHSYLSGWEGWLAPAAETIKIGGGKPPYLTIELYRIDRSYIVAHV